MALRDDIKSLMRISSSTTAFDGEIDDLIAAAKDDLKLSGVIPEKVALDTDPLIKRAVSTYVKTNFGWDNPDADRLQQSYNMLKTHLTLSQEYSSYAVTFTVSHGASSLENALVKFNGYELITDASGQAIFFGVRKEQNMKYTVILVGYAEVESLVDVNGSVTVSVALTAVV